MAIKPNPCPTLFVNPSIPSLTKLPMPISHAVTSPRLAEQPKIGNSPRLSTLGIVGAVEVLVADDPEDLRLPVTEVATDELELPETEREDSGMPASLVSAFPIHATFVKPSESKIFCTFFLETGVFEMELGADLVWADPFEGMSDPYLTLPFAIVTTLDFWMGCMTGFITGFSLETERT